MLPQPRLSEHLFCLSELPLESLQLFHLCLFSLHPQLIRVVHVGLQSWLESAFLELDLILLSPSLLVFDLFLDHKMKLSLMDWLQVFVEEIIALVYL